MIVSVCRKNLLEWVVFFVLKWYKNGAINMLEKYKKDLSQTKLVIVDKFVPKDHLLRKIKDSLNKSRPAN